MLQILDVDVVAESCMEGCVSEGHVMYGMIWSMSVRLMYDF